MCSHFGTGFELSGTAIFNGSNAFHIGTSKWLHHSVLEKAGGATPPSVIVQSWFDLKEHATAKDSPLRYPLLLKPNAGGFGAGIVRFSTPEDAVKTADEAIALGQDLDPNDGVAVLQEYYEPAGGTVYRVWHVGGRVQCGVATTFLDGSHGKEFGGACAATGCVLQNRVMKPWRVPESVARVVEATAKLSGADCGSVELLYPEEAPTRAVIE